MGLLSFLGLRESKEAAPETQTISIEIPAASVFGAHPKHTRLTETAGIFPLGDLDAGTIFSDRNFINLSQVSPLDLPPERLQTAQRLSLLLWSRNPRAYRAIELVKDFALGNGVRFVAADDSVQEVLDEHWDLNQWEEKIEERMRELALFGEELYPAATNDMTGIVRVTTITPLRIRAVDANPEDAAQIFRIRTGLKKRPRFTIIRRDAEGHLRGEAFYFAVNRVAGQLRGRPDLLASIDWLEGLDGFIFALMERADLSQNIVIDLEYEGLQEEQIRERVESFIRQINDGGIFAHNEKVKIKIISPNLASSDQKGAVEIIQKQIQAGTGIPGLGFGDGGDLTRASAAELTIPVAKMIGSRQRFFKRLLMTIFEYQIEEAIRVGRLKADVDQSFKIEMAKVFLRDLTTSAQAVAALVPPLEIAVQNQWITNDQASDAFRIALEQIGKPFEAPVGGGSETLNRDEMAVATAINRVRDQTGRNGGDR